MRTSPLFIQYYSKHIIALFIIITAVIGLDVAVRDANLLSYDNSGAVKGESTVNLDST